jgi:lysophospholipase L1-like esterase
MFIRITLVIMVKASVVFAQEISLVEPVRFLALGDSYTIGESVAPAERWPVQLINKLKSKHNVTCYDPTIIATTGWRTDQLKASIIKNNIQPEQYNLVSLLIGVNNQYQGKSVDTYKQEFTELVQMALAIVKDDKARLFVLSIPDYGYTPFGKAKQEKISKELEQFNAVNQSVCQQMGIAYCNITDISQQGLNDPGLVAADGLHPSGKMYGAWVDRILSRLTFVTDK